MHGDPEPGVTIVSIILFAWLLVTAFGYAKDIGPADAIIGFFSQPRPLIVYALILAVPAYFFRYLVGGAFPMFVAGMILFLALRAGLQ